jgi:hypothetical protein
MSVIGSNILAGASGNQGGAYNLTNSVRFRQSASAYLTRTPASAGNRKTWTWSAWIKRGALDSSYQTFFEVYNANNDNQLFGITWANTNEILLNSYNVNYRITTAVYRDPSAWYHLMVVVDTTQATAADRIKIYVNGVQVTSFSTSNNPSQNADLAVNQAAAHYLGSGNNRAYSDGYMTEINFIDGQALTPSDFGATNASTGVWQPIKYAGTYGTNGFYLPFTNNTQYFSGLFDGTTQTAYAGYNNVLNLETSAYTVEAFVNPTSLSNANGQQQVIGRWYSGVNRRSYMLGINNDGSVYWLASTNGNTGSGNAVQVVSSAGAVTTNTWTHIRISQTGGTVYLGINGTIVTTATDAIFNNVYTSTDPVSLGSALQGDTSTVFTGRISNVRIVKGTALSTTTYTVPTAPLTAISGTSLLTLQSPTLVDNSGNSLTITNPSSNPSISSVAPTQFGTVGYGKDFSGNNNTWTTNNLSYTVGSTYDSMTDVPTLTSATAANFCVMNPLFKNTDFTLTGGNLNVSTSSVADKVCGSTIGVSSGKYYWEVTINGGAGTGIGICSNAVNLSSYLGGDANGYSYDWNANKYNNAVGTAYGASYTTGDVIGVALDMDAGTLTYYKNNASQGQAFSGISGTFFPAIGDQSSSGNVDASANFGQRPFTYTPPTGFVALNTFNLPTPTIGATATTQAEKYIDVSLYSGTSASGNNITDGLSLSSGGLLWIKNRNNTGNHALVDSVRGIDKRLISDSTNAESTNTSVTSFNSNGFTVNGNDGSFNLSGRTYVAWQWLANGTGVSNTAGSITSTVSANTSAGFSVVTYTGTGANATVGHGLGVAPSMIIFKNRTTSARNWICYHASIGATVFLELNTTAAQNSDSTQFNNTAPTSTVFSVGSSTNTNQNTNGQVAYCFSEVAGYSKFGSYTGNGGSDGPFVYTGFKPRFIMVKGYSSAGNAWEMIDTARSPYNAVNALLRANSDGSEQTSGPYPDILSNGFKARSANGYFNDSGVSYIYMAFAENPFKYSLAR